MNMKYKERCEDTEQALFIQWCNHHEDIYPDLHYLHHIPNGGKRDPREAGKLKQMGVKRGVPDLSLPVPKGRYIGLYIEMKYKDNVPTKEQADWLNALTQTGHYCCICYSAAGAVKITEEYLNLSGGAEMSGASLEENFSYQVHSRWNIPVIKPFDLFRDFIYQRSHCIACLLLQAGERRAGRGIAR